MTAILYWSFSKMKKMDWDNYCEDILSGKIKSGVNMRLAAKRYIRMRKNPDYDFRENKVKRVIKFISSLKHYTGKHAGNSFLLLPWQSFVIACIYGFYNKDTNNRVVKYAYIEMARKQGKSALAAALCLYHTVADGEANAEVYLAANSKDQAKIAYKMCTNFAKTIDPKGQVISVQRDKIEFETSLSTLKALASDDSKLDGFNASMYLLDEYHAAKNNRLKDVLQSSQGMRENPMAIIITTAGFDKLGVCYEYRSVCIDILNELKKDDSIFIAIFSLDENDDWKNEENWIKSNPNLGVTVKAPYIREQIQKAINSPSEEVSIKTKTINIWCDSSEVWIPEHYILDVSEDVDVTKFEGEECFVGVDLSSTSDLAAVTALFPSEGDGKLYFKTRYYLPEAALKEKRFKALYGEWRRAKQLIVTPGNVIDYDYILNDLLELDKKVFINVAAYDQWNATQFVINATDKGLNMEPYSQTLGNFNRPTKELERLILSKRAVIDNNIINRHCFRNVTMKIDYMGNTKPTKQYEEKKIDGVISKLMALGVYLVSPRYSATI